MCAPLPHDCPSHCFLTAMSVTGWERSSCTWSLTHGLSATCTTVTQRRTEERMGRCSWSLTHLHSATSAGTLESRHRASELRATLAIRGLLPTETHHRASERLTTLATRDFLPESLHHDCERLATIRFKDSRFVGCGADGQPLVVGSVFSKLPRRAPPRVVGWNRWQLVTWLCFALSVFLAALVAVGLLSLARARQTTTRLKNRRAWLT